MRQTDWGLIWETFEAVVVLPPEVRASWLDRRDIVGARRRAVEDLLVADAGPGSFLDRPMASFDPVDSPPGLAKGSRLGTYRILRRLGQGGMSVVYLAVRDDGAFDRRVVIKLVRPEMQCNALADRLRAEGRFLAALEHPNIARLYDGGNTPEGAPYFVMEYVEGEPIDRWCEGQELSIDERLTLVRKVCAAVQAAHQNLVVHRDLKPSNILVDRHGEPKLLDFGIAKWLAPEVVGEGLEPTATVHRVLTPSHASPEQIAGRPITTASDVYSLGVLLYQLLTGRLPYSVAGRSVHELDRLLQENEPPPPSSHCRALAGDLDAIVLKALRSAPRQRYGSVEQLAADLERHQGGLPVAARAGTWRYRAGRFVRRHRRGVAAAVAMAALLVGFTVASVLQSRRVAFERDQARSERDQKTQVLALIREVFRHSSPYNTPGEELTVRQALERSLPVLERGLGTQLDVRAELLHTTGSILLEVGRYEAARERLEEALALRQALYGETHPDVVLTLGVLVSTYRQMGAFGPAEIAARRGLETARRVVEQGDGGSELIADALAQLARVFGAQGDFEAAEPLARESLALAHGLEEGEGATLLALQVLARVHDSQGESREAARLNREVLTLLQRRDGPGHPSQISALYNLGTDHYRQGDVETAQRFFDQALGLIDSTFGEAYTDPYLFGNLGNFHAHNGQFVRARELYQRVRDAIRRNDPDDSTVFYFEQRLAWSRTYLGEPVEAEAELRRLLATWGPRLGDHWQLGEGLGLLGDTVSHQGRCQEAEALLVESLDSAVDKGRKCLQRAALRRLENHYDRCGHPETMERFAALASELGPGLGPR